MLHVGQLVRPPIAADRDRVAAAVVGAIDQQAAHPLSRISAKMIFLRAVKHASMRRATETAALASITLISPDRSALSGTFQRNGVDATELMLVAYGDQHVLGFADPVHRPRTDV
jgi:hypothetical protein